MLQYVDTKSLLQCCQMILHNVDDEIMLHNVDDQMILHNVDDKIR